MNPDDAKLLQELIALGNTIPCDMGRFMFSYHFMSNMTSGYISFMLDWKCENGEASFNNLTEALKELRWIKERVDAYKAETRDA